MLKLCKLLSNTIFSEAEKRAKPSHLERRNRLNSHKMNPENHLTNNLIVKLQFIELASLSYLYLSSLKHNTTNTLIIKKKVFICSSLFFRYTCISNLSKT